jgi:Calcineurin-like phosphoesterase
MSKIFACGDVHGHLDKLVAALQEAGLINERLEWCGGNSILVMLGDVIDRGPDSKGVVSLLMRLKWMAQNIGGRVVCLMGNHEMMMLDGLTDDTQGSLWRANGGMTCLLSYGIGIGSYYVKRHTMEILKVHGVYYSELKQHYQIGSTMFVHAGLVPAHNLKWLNHPEYMGHLWVRSHFFDHPDANFLKSNYGVERVVFGHTHQPGFQPLVRHGGAFLGIDTGSGLVGGHVTIVELLDGLEFRVAGQG